MSAIGKVCTVCLAILALSSSIAGAHTRVAHHRRTLAHKAGGAATPVSVLAPTPYMGWDSYFAFGSHYDEATILEQASQMRTKGLIKTGYNYLWLDVGWWEGKRGAAGEITVNPKQWPHGMKWLVSTLHAAGLKVGLYTDAGSEGCGGKTQGSYGHYQQDVNTFAAWGIDAVKVDFCGGVRQGLAPARAYGEFHEAIVHNSSNRPMLLSICDYLQPGQFESEVPTFENSSFASYTFGPSVGNSWRTDTDVGVPGDVEWSSVLRNLDADAANPEAAGPGHWNDPDYLGPDQGMSAAQFRAQFSMWAMLAAPLMISEDLLSMSSATRTTVTNREAIAIDQDPAGLQGRLLEGNSEAEVWVKPLANGTRAVALLNRSSKTLQIDTTAAAVGMPGAPAYQVRDVWTGSVTNTTGAIGAGVPRESVVLFRVSSAARAIEAVPRR
ncbi:MAG TPA: glycoside hydrolase family 27 protein [Solirubrobacteraceae bacterium]|jgi:alpha-galactosidase|nr:glycoside hydrolase family 27 protein [Solirubrobacteraceae bacterium]